jgi:hypothetical protein
VVPFQYCVRQPCPLFKMAAVTKNRNFFSCQFLLYYKSKEPDTILKGDHPRTIPAKFALIWFSGFRGEDLNVIFYQNMSNLCNGINRLKEKFQIYFFFPFLAHLAKGHVSFCHHLTSVSIRRKLSHLNLLL